MYNYTLENLKFDLEDSIIIVDDLLEAINNFKLLDELENYISDYDLDLNLDELQDTIIDNVDSIIQDLIEFLESINDSLEDLDTSKVYVISEEKKLIYIENISNIIMILNSVDSSDENNLKVDGANIKKQLSECLNYEIKIKAEQSKKYNEQTKRNRRDLNGLTKKQREIKKLITDIKILLTENKSIKNIANELNISESKVKRLKKLGSNENV